MLRLHLSHHLARPRLHRPLRSQPGSFAQRQLPRRVEMHFPLAGGNAAARHEGNFLESVVIAGPGRGSGRYRQLDRRRAKPDPSPDSGAGFPNRILPETDPQYVEHESTYDKW